MKEYLNKVADECIHCSACTKKCSFLTKYEIDLGEFAKNPSLAKSCFMCDSCLRACPLDLDGAEVAIAHREDLGGYGAVKFMKSPYKFRNNSKIKSKDVLMFGCAFPGHYPETTKYLIDLFEGKMDFSIDCCGKPLEDSGLISDFEKNLERLKKIYKEKGVERIVTMCPNCFYFFKGHMDKLNIEVISIYQKLQEENLLNVIDDEAEIFMPCPDKRTNELLKQIKPFVPNGKVKFRKVMCCGMGGGAKAKEKDLANEMMNKVKSEVKDNIYTYCASCSASFKKSNIKNVKHILSEILGVKEKVDLNYFKNALKLKFYKRNRK
ncbi:cysteine-rich domain protein [Parvimonas sp. KA00067]|uniref:(Fe-S)-binding protein n=1 Tax=Parvimonas sp. KA00067 TaxID=1588755 RepID=UPI000798C8B3|nr:(Fe-S)-binding protein [Parvimonas sp. KA00067]KXB64484.1 cysteine-rich domain protein [Parvimonas sp. KA00067]